MKKTTYILAALATLSFATAHAQEYSASGADNFAAATPILTGSALSTPTDLHIKSAEPGEPSHAPSGSSAGKSAWWKWTAPQTGWCTVDTLAVNPNPSSIKDSVLAVYTSGPGVLGVDNLIPVAKNDDAFLPVATTPYSRITFRAILGVTYYIAVDAKSLDDIDAFASPLGKIETQLTLALLPDNTAFQATGVFYDPSDPAQHALITASKTAKNSYSAKLHYRGKTYSLRGNVPPNGRSIAVIPVKNDPAPIVLHLNFAGLPATIHLEKDQDIIVGNLVRVLPRNTLDPALLGRHTLVMEEGTGLQGYGIGSYVVKPSGDCAGAFILPDGVAFTASAKALDTGNAGNVALFGAYKSLHKKQGSALLLWSANSSTQVSNAAVFYHRPAGSGSFYPAGITAAFNGSSSPYSKPASGRFSGALDASGGDGILALHANLVPADTFPGINIPVNLSDKNRFTFSDASLKPKLTFNLNTGLITGSIRPDPSQPAFKIRAAALAPDLGIGVHFFGHYQTRFSTGMLMITPP